MTGEEVQVSKGLKRFFILFILFAASGIFTNRFIQQSVKNYWLSLAGQMQQQGLNADSPRVVFSRYSLPTFGAQIDSAHWKQTTDCRELLVEATEIFIPIPFFELLISRPKAGAIKIQSLVAEHIDEPICSAGPLQDALKSESQPSSKPSVVDSKEIGEPELQPFPKEKVQSYIEKFKRMNVNLPFTRVDIHSIVLKNIFLSGKMISAQGRGAIDASDDFAIDVSLNPLVIKKDSKSLETKMHITAAADEKIMAARVDWSYHEGHLVAESQISQEGNINVQLVLRDLPLSVVNRWLGTPWTFQFLWADCSLSLTSHLNSMDSDAWQATDCRVRGPQGSVKIANASIQSLRSTNSLKVDVLIESINVDSVVKGVSELPLAGVMNKFGILSGEILFRNREIKSTINAKGPEILFSRNNKRTIQEIESLDVVTNYSNKKWSLSLQKASLREGQFEGSVVATYDKKTSEWSSDIQVASLSFAPSVQQVMLGGTLSPVRVNGAITSSKKEPLSSLKLKGGFKELKVDGFSVEDASFVMDQSVDGLRLGMGLSRMDIYRGTKFDWLFASLLDRVIATEKMSLTRVHLDSLVSPGKLIFKNFVGTGFNGKLELKGEFSADVHQGEMLWALPKRTLAWTWRQEGDQVTLFPQSQDIRDWLELNSDFIEEFKGVKILPPKENEAA
jgi:hypothetical protein